MLDHSLVLAALRSATANHDTATTTCRSFLAGRQRPIRTGRLLQLAIAHSDCWTSIAERDGERDHRFGDASSGGIPPAPDYQRSANARCGGERHALR